MIEFVAWFALVHRPIVIQIIFSLDLVSVINIYYSLSQQISICITYKSFKKCMY